MPEKSVPEQVRGERVCEKILCTALDLVFELGFREVSMECIAARGGVAKTTIYRRWPNKAAVVMEAFMARFGPGTRFPPADSPVERIRLQMRRMARAFRGRDGALVKCLLAECQFDDELAKEFSKRWTIPRREMATEVFREAIQAGELRSDIDIGAAIDMLYAPMCYRLLTGAGPLSDEYVDGLFRQALRGLG